MDSPKADSQASQDSGHRVSIASDVDGGTKLRLPRTLAAAYQVQVLRGTKLNAFTALHAAIRVAGPALGLSHAIGHLEGGTLADLAVCRWTDGPVARHPDAVATGAEAGLAAQDLHTRVFAWLTLAAERNLVAAYLAGRRVTSRA